MRHRYQKKPEADLRSDYTVTLQGTLIFALLVAIIAFNLNVNFGKGFEIEEIVREELELEDIIQTEIIETPPPPPRPPVPIEVPDDAILDDELLDLDAFLDIDSGFDAPPPPPPPDEDDEPEIFQVVEHMPEMVGGQRALYDVLQYPSIARRAGIEGRVILQFVVDERGNVVDPRVVRGAGSGLDEAALEAIKKVSFTPGMQRGRPVKVQFTQTVIFRLN